MAIQNGTPHATKKIAISWQKRRGKRFQAFLAEIAVRSSGDPLIELLTFFFVAFKKQKAFFICFPPRPRCGRSFDVFLKGEALSLKGLALTLCSRGLL